MKCSVIKLCYTVAFFLRHIVGNLLETRGLLEAGVCSAARCGHGGLRLVPSVPDSAWLRNLTLSPSPMFRFALQLNDIFHLYFGYADE